MPRAKPLPYKANQLKDDAIMCNANAAREILTLMKGDRFTPEEAMRRLGMALHHIHESTTALKEIDGVER
ncbi:hypothetical protein KA005_61040 [bacterium]|nr:hypothetical protein [bacterium]